MKKNNILIALAFLIEIGNICLLILKEQDVFNFILLTLGSTGVIITAKFSEWEEKKSQKEK